MATKADFYIGRGADAEWIGSVAWDGYPSGIWDVVLEASSINEFRYGVAAFLDECNGIAPEEGWPWPWADSGDTDYVYAFDGRVWVACDGHGWLTREGAINDLWEDTEPVVFPVQFYGQRRAV